MNIKSLDEILENIKEKNNKINSTINNIINSDKRELKINQSNLELLDSINNNQQIILDKLEDFKIEVYNLEKDLSYEQKLELREAKFQKLIEKVFYPYIIYMRLSMFSN